MDNLKTLKEVSTFFEIPHNVIMERCRFLNISTVLNDISNTYVYKFDNIDIARIIIFEQTIIPKIIRIEKEIVYNIYESKLNTQND
jgi:uncharacterized protein YkuJ